MNDLGQGVMLILPFANIHHGGVEYETGVICPSTTDTSKFGLAPLLAEVPIGNVQRVRARRGWDDVRSHGNTCAFPSMETVSFVKLRSQSNRICLAINSIPVMNTSGGWVGSGRSSLFSLIEFPPLAFEPSVSTVTLSTVPS